MDDECWDDVSDMAKDFIKKLLLKDPKERLTAESALVQRSFSLLSSSPFRPLLFALFVVPVSFSF